jgi:beta-lactamase class C
MRLATLALIAALAAASAAVAQAQTDGDVERLVTRELKPMVPADGAGGAAVAVRIGGRTLYFNYGFADLAAKRPITSDSLFNLASLRKLFEVTLLARALKQGELSFDDPVAKYVVELQQGGYIRRVTLGQLATHTSGLLLRSDYPPGRRCATRWRSSSAWSTAGSRIADSNPASSTPIPIPRSCCCSLRWSAGTARRSAR